MKKPAALRQRAEEHNAGVPGPVTRWTVEAGEGLEPLPAAHRERFMADLRVLSRAADAALPPLR